MCLRNLHATPKYAEIIDNCIRNLHHRKMERIYTNGTKQNLNTKHLINNKNIVLT